MNKLLLVLLLVAVVAVAACAFNQGKDDGFTTVGVDEFERTIADTAGVQLLDVRGQDEYDEGHIPGAHIINMRDSNFMQQVDAELVKDKPIAIYCRSGRRSATAASKLAKNGYTVINLDGGIIAWQQHGKNVMK